MVEGQAARGVLPARVIGEALNGLPVGESLQALEDHYDRRDQGWDAPAAEVREQVGKGLVGEQRETLPREQGVHRVGADPRSAELGRVPEHVSPGGAWARATSVCSCDLHRTVPIRSIT